MWWLAPAILLHGGWNRKTVVTDCVDQASPWLPGDGFGESLAEDDCLYPSQRNGATGLTSLMFYFHIKHKPCFNLSTFSFFFSNLKPHSGCQNEPKMGPGSSLVSRSPNNSGQIPILQFCSHVHVTEVRFIDLALKFRFLLAFLGQALRGVGGMATEGSLHDFPLVFISLFSYLKSCSRDSMKSFFLSTPPLTWLSPHLPLTSQVFVNC